MSKWDEYNQRRARQKLYSMDDLRPGLPLLFDGAGPLDMIDEHERIEKKDIEDDNQHNRVL